MWPFGARMNRNCLSGTAACLSSTAFRGTAVHRPPPFRPTDDGKGEKGEKGSPSFPPPFLRRDGKREGRSLRCLPSGRGRSGVPTGALLPHGPGARLI